jgi:phytoene desaturase
MSLAWKGCSNNVLGAAWGVEPKLTQTAIFRPHNRSEDVQHLYLVGASTHPGAGVPGVLLTAETTERVIREDLGNPMTAEIVSSFSTHNEEVLI